MVYIARCTNRNKHGILLTAGTDVRKQGQTDISDTLTILRISYAADNKLRLG